MMNNQESKDEYWTEIVEPRDKIINLKFKELYQYRDLAYMLVRRDFVTVFKQTVLGPFWYLFPILATSITYLIVFSKVAKLPTDNIPPLLFYISGLLCWNFFIGCFTDCSNVFQANASLFGKVYFPRLVVPIAKAFSNLLKLVIQLVMFLGIYSYYLLDGYRLSVHWTVFLLPVYFIVLAIQGCGLGIIVASITTKYRDLGFLVNLFVKLFIYLTPVIYPLSMVKGKLRLLMYCNPLSSIIEGFKFACIGGGSFNIYGILYSVIFTVLLFFISILIFNKLEKNFIDTV